MRHIKQLDGLRFMAVFFVLLEHIPSIIGPHISAGYYGVDLFFVISGFLITGILIRSVGSFGKAYKKFIGRRTLRIFPLYYLTVVVLLLAGNPVVKKYLLNFLTYTYNYIWISKESTTQGSMGHIWSLCVEEQFYLVWPFLILSLRKNINALKTVIILLIVFCFAQYYFGVIPAWKPYNVVSIIPRSFSLAIGGLGAILLQENKIDNRILDNLWIELLGWILMIGCVVSDHPARFTVGPVVSLFLILKTTHKGFLITPLNHFFNNQRIVYWGAISYGIYLFHVPVEYYFSRYIFNPLFWDRIPFESFGAFKKVQWHSWIIKFPLYTAISIMLAHLSYKYFEKPFLSLKDRYFKY